MTSVKAQLKANVIGAPRSIRRPVAHHWSTAGDSLQRHRAERTLLLPVRALVWTKAYNYTWSKELQLDNYLPQGITMDCSEEVQSLSDEASTPIELKKGMSIFLDVSILKHFFKTLSDCNNELFMLNDKRKLET